MVDWSIDYYGVLGLSVGVSKQEIRRSWQRLTKTWHTDKIQQGRAASGKCLKTLGPNKESCGNNFAGKSDLYFCSEGCKNANIECSLKIVDINLAWDVLNNQKDHYDTYCDVYRFNCIGVNSAGMGCSRTGLKRGGCVKSRKSCRYFCSKACAASWNKAKGYDYSSGTRTGSGTPPTPPPSTPPRGSSNLKVCPGCVQSKRFNSLWVRYSDSSEYCCSEYCLFDYLVKMGENPKQCARCYTCRKEVYCGWIRGQVDRNDVYCSEEHRREKEEGAGFGLGNPDPDPTQPDPTPPSSDINMIRANAINIIKRKLGEEPKILVSELSDPNWEARINREAKESIIEQIRDEILSDIVAKRKSKIQQGGLEQLIISAQNAKNNNEMTRLGELLVEIKSKYQNTAIYQSKLSTIAELEQYYSTHSPKSDVQRNIVASLTAILQNPPPVNVDELDEQNHNFTQDIQNAASLQESQAIEARVQDNINEKRTGKIVNNLLVRAQQVDKADKEEIARLRQEIMSLRKSKDKWGEHFWNKNANNFEAILLEWSGGEKGKQDNDSSLFEKYWPIGLAVLAVSGVVYAVWRFDIIRRLKQRKKIKK